MPVTSSSPIRAITAWTPTFRCGFGAGSDHLKLVPLQRQKRGWSGQIVTNPNCSTIVLTMASGR